jgi:hypothetical protein
VIGYFSPAAQKNSEAYARAAAHFDLDELKERKLSNQTGRTPCGQKVIRSINNGATRPQSPVAGSDHQQKAETQ